MDLRSQLIECCKQKGQSRWKCSLASIGIHLGIVAFIVFMGASATHRIDAEEKPVRAFLESGAAPPPPPPPPPAPSSAPKSTPTPTIKPVQVQTAFVQPREIPQELPKVVTPATSTALDTNSAAQTPSSDQAGGVPGGVAGGVAGGVEGGVVGGQIGGVVGGIVNGNGTTTGDTAPPPPPPPPPEPPPAPKEDEGPLRVGGDVKAPVVVHRTEPKYTDTARRAHTTGVVIVEATIDKNGNVDRVKVLKGLDFGLTEQAVEAVKQWKFRPGTLNGEPVEVLFNLTVNFTLE